MGSNRSPWPFFMHFATFWGALDGTIQGPFFNMEDYGKNKERSFVSMTNKELPGLSSVGAGLKPARITEQITHPGGFETRPYGL